MRKKTNPVWLIILVIGVAVFLCIASLSKDSYYSRMLSFTEGKEYYCGRQIPHQITKVADIEVGENVFELKRDTLKLVDKLGTTVNGTLYVWYQLDDSHGTSWNLYTKPDKKFYIMKLKNF